LSAAEVDLKALPDSAEENCCAELAMAVDCMEELEAWMAELVDF